MDSDVTFATPGLDDLDAITTLWTDLVRDQRPYGTRLRADENEPNARSWLATRMTFDQIRVANSAGAIIGFVTFERMHDQFVRYGQAGIVHTLYVTPDRRNDGIGSALLARAEEILLDRGVDRVRLELLVENERAKSFYRDRGYHPYRTIYRKPFDQTDTHNANDSEG